MIIYRFFASHWARRNFLPVVSSHHALLLHNGELPSMSPNQYRHIGAVVRKDGEFTTNLLTSDVQIQQSAQQGFVLVNLG